MIKCEIKDSRIDAEFYGSGEKLFREVIAIMDIFAKKVLDESLNDFIRELYEHDPQEFCVEQAEAQDETDMH